MLHIPSFKKKPWRKSKINKPSSMTLRRWAMRAQMCDIRQNRWRAHGEVFCGETVEKHVFSTRKQEKENVQNKHVDRARSPWLQNRPATVGKRANRNAKALVMQSERFANWIGTRIDDEPTLRQTLGIYFGNGGGLQICAAKGIHRGMSREWSCGMLYMGSIFVPRSYTINVISKHS